MRISSLTTPLGPDTLSLRQIEGGEGINTLFRYTLQAYSVRDDISANALLGKPVSISIDDQHGNPVYLHAIVSEFKRRGRKRSSRHTEYEAVLMPWLWLSKHQADCRVFENKTAAEIIAEVLSVYPFPIQLKVKGGEKLPHVVQYNESDFDFMCRLMEAHGISYRFLHEANQHTLMLSDDVITFGKVPGHDSIPFRAAHHVAIADEETVSKWTPSQTITSGSFTTSDYDYRAPGARLIANSSGTYPIRKHDFANLPVFHWMGQQRYTDPQIGSRIAELRQDQQEQEFAHIEAESDVRAMLFGATGLRFKLDKHPERAFNEEVMMLSSEMSFRENPGATAGGEHTEWRVNFNAVSSKYHYRPKRITPLPYIRGPQTAIVVGPAGQELWVNDLGQVKIRLWWDRGTPDGGWELWVRVSSSWAGNGLGEVMLPRIGDEVIILFLDGDPSKPIIVGCVNNTNRLPAAFSNTGSLPSNHALAGIKSREIAGSRYNQLLFDDSTGEIRTQLESEHGKTQLNLGYLTHPRDASAAARGEGVELRTDLWGAFRAAKGLQITTYAQQAASGQHLDTSEATGQLDAALGQAKAHSTMAQKHNADELEANDSLKHLKEVTAHEYKQGKSSMPGYNEPILVLSSPAGIAQTTQKAIVVAAGTDIHLTSQLHTNMSIGRRLSMAVGEAWSVFVERAGIKLFAGKGKVQIQAQSDNLELIAQKDVLVHSVDQRVEVAAAKEILLSAGGGAYIRITPNKVEIVSPGDIDKKAANYSLMGPGSLAKDMPSLPKSESKVNEFFVVRNRQTGEPIPNRRYKVTTDSGKTFEGVTDAQGKTELLKGDIPEALQIKVFPPKG